MTETLTAAPGRSALVTQLLRSLCHLIAVVAIAVWAFLAWPMPLGILTGLLALALAVVVWALFLSPRPVLRTDRFGQALIELLLVGGGAAAMLSLGVFWALPAGFFAFAALLGFLGGRKA